MELIEIGLEGVDWLRVRISGGFFVKRNEL
jgi:hypothetical protein